MANLKVVDATQLDADLTIVADAIRSKGGTTEQLEFPQGMASAIGSIQSGGGSAFPELIYETTFTVDETIPSGGNSATMCTISTGLSVDFIKKNYEPIVVNIELISMDNSVDTSAFNNWFSHTLQYIDNHQGYLQIGNNQRWKVGRNYPDSNQKYGLYVNSGTQDLSSIVINNRPADTTVAKGTYKLKIYRLGFEHGKV